MMRKLLPVLFLVFAVSATHAESLYYVNSKAVGWDSIDLTISETKREGSISILNIPHYEKRSSVESRFAMCTFTDMAIQRGFEAWVVSNRPVSNDLVRVGFLKSEHEDASKTLGSEFAGDGVFRAEVGVMNRMCGITRVK